MPLHSPLIIQNARLQIVDVLLAIILGSGNKIVTTIVANQYS